MPNNMKKAGMSYGKGGSKKMSYKKGGSKRYKKGGSKPDYLDLDKDGNKTEPMKSTYYGGGSVYTKKGKKIPGMQMGGANTSEADMKAKMRMQQGVPAEPDFPPMENDSIRRIDPTRFSKQINQYNPDGSLVQTPGMNRSMLTQEMIDAGYTADEEGMIDGPKKGPEMMRRERAAGPRYQKGGAVYTKKGMRVPGMRKGR